MRQDKLLELRKAQFRRNRLPALASSHQCHPQIWTLTDLAPPIKTPGLTRLADKFSRVIKPQPVVSFNKKPFASRPPGHDSQVLGNRAG
jgi:hypothetical protein